MPYIPINLEETHWDELLKGSQNGNGHFKGIPFQRGGMRGRGIGGIISTLLRMIPAFFSSPLGLEVANAGKNIVSDVIRGEKLKDVAKTHTRKAVKNLTGLGGKRIKGPVGVLKRQLQPSLRGKRSYLFKNASPY